MMSWGTTSNNVGKKSSPCARANVSSSATRASNMRLLPRVQKRLQHLIEFCLVGDGHTEELGMMNGLQDMLQRTGARRRLAAPAIEARLIVVADFAVAYHATVRQQCFDQRLASRVIA